MDAGEGGVVNHHYRVTRQPSIVRTGKEQGWRSQVAARKYGVSAGEVSGDLRIAPTNFSGHAGGKDKQQGIAAIWNSENGLAVCNQRIIAAVQTAGAVGVYGDRFEIRGIWHRS